MKEAPKIALVMIGRNEAKNLAISLPNMVPLFNKVIYVDSGSTDGSQALASKFGVDVIDLDVSQPFTAARARNAGLEAILESEVDFKYIQFIDGDCELIPAYLAQALEFLELKPDYAMTCGRRVERYPEDTIFNTLCDIEWNTPVGETDYCGGDLTIRVDAIRQIGGYRANLIAGEDPELCVRIRQQGWNIYRIDADMTRHDANITRISQWWKRAERAGYAFAEGASIHGDTPQRHWVDEARKNWLWGSIFIGILTIGLFLHPVGFMLLSIFPLHALRIALKPIPILQDRPPSVKLLYGLDCAFTKIPEFSGQLRFWFNKLFNRNQKIIEYK